jgi:hypothetical protein
MLSYPGRVFSRTAETDRTPGDLIQPTEQQSRALGAVLLAVRTGDSVHLKIVLTDLCVALICHDTNTKVFSSAIVSFCALLSVKQSTRTWKEPGNLNTNLSGIVWTVQLLIFYHSVYEERKQPKLSSLSPHVRVAMHIGAPSIMIDFAQEAGRAGRDRERAYSFVLLPHKWQVRTTGGLESDDLVRDRQAMECYLMGEQCFRTLLSTYLDNEQDRRQCMAEEDLLCDVCARGGIQSVGGTAREMVHEAGDKGDEKDDSKTWIGNPPMARRRFQEQADRDRYKELLLVAEGCCMLCRCRGMQWDHTFDKCGERHQVLHARAAVLRRLDKEGKRWLAPLKACFWCYNPQSLCGRADKERQVLKCRFRDIVLH